MLDTLRILKYNLKKVDQKFNMLYTEHDIYSRHNEWGVTIL